MNDDSLWDPKAPEDPDDDVRSLEGALLPHRWRPRPLELPDEEPQADPELGPQDDPELGPLPGELPDDASDDASEDADAEEPVELGAPQVLTGWRRAVGLAVAAAMLLFFLGDGLGWFGGSVSGGDPTRAEFAVGYSLEAIEGRARIERAGAAAWVVDETSVQPGDRILCAGDSRARLRVGPLGSVVIDPDTDLRVDDAGDGENAWSVYLERGGLRASIFAAPRLFQMGTPSGIAVDLGCVYTARVEDDGTTLLAVESGRVSFETAERQVLVPRGARVVAIPGRGPGTPVWEDADPTLVAAVERLDRTAQAGLWGAAEVASLAALAEVDRPRDTLTLWHLLDHPREEVRRGAYDGLARLVPPPDGLTWASCESKSGPLGTWRESCESTWW